MSTFADRLRAAMNASNMSASELAEKTKISKATISRYLSGGFLPKQKNTYLLSKALDVDVAYLVFGDKGYKSTIRNYNKYHHAENQRWVSDSSPGKSSCRCAPGGRDGHPGL